MNVQKVTTLNQNGTATVNRQPSLGILGGAFDPVHNGHLKMARVAMEEGGLDKVIFIPVAVSPLKTGGPVAESQARLAMLEIALADYPDYVVSGIELDREGISYTIDTLRELREDYGPAAELTLIIGMDNFLSIAGWRDIESLIEMSKFIIISRPGFKINRLAGKDKYWADKIMDRGRGRIISLSIPVSSTEIRDAIREGKAFSQWLPSSTAEYIGQNELYQ